MKYFINKHKVAGADYTALLVFAANGYASKYGGKPEGKGWWIAPAFLQRREDKVTLDEIENDDNWREITQAEVTAIYLTATFLK